MSTIAARGLVAADAGAERRELVLMIAGLAWAAGVIHAIAAVEHFDEHWQYGVLFALLAPAQLAWGALAYRSPTRGLLAAGALGGLLVGVVWAVSRTTGLPAGPEAWRPEAAGVPDVTATLDEAAVALLVSAALGRLSVARTRGLWRLGALWLMMVSLLASLGGGHHADAHPGHGPQPVEISAFAYRPSDITISTGDPVIWTWAGPDTNHTVTADEGQAVQFESDPGRDPGQVNHDQGSTFAFQFTQVGTYGYHCRVHPTMHGTVSVIPSPNDTTPPTIRDMKVAPRSACSRRSARCRTDRARLSLTLSETASLAVELRRRRRFHGRRISRVSEAQGRPGANVVTLRPRGLPAGSYRVVVTAIDLYGNPSRPVSAPFLVR